MRRNTLLVGLAAIMVIGLTYAARLHHGAAADSFPDLVELVPADATVVAYADVTALRNSVLVQYLAAMAQPTVTDPDYAEFVRSTNFDYQRDLDRVLLTVRSGPVAETLVFADGRFDRERIEQYALRSGKSHEQDGHRVYVVPSAKSGKNISITFLNAGRIALSDGGDIASALQSQKRGSEQSTTSNDALLRERISRISGSPIFAVAKAPASVAAAGAANGLPAFTPFASLRWVSLAVKPEGEQVTVSAEGECDNPDAARNLATSLEFMRTILHGGLSNPNARGSMTPETAVAADQLLTAVRITSDASRVRLLLPVSPEMLRSVKPQTFPRVPARPVPAVPPQR